MTKRLTAVVLLIGALNLTLAYAISSDDAKEMAQKYGELAQSYADLAKHYELIVDGNHKGKNLVVNAKEIVQKQKLNNAIVAVASQGFSSTWSDSLQGYKNKTGQKEVQFSGSNAKSIMPITTEVKASPALNSLNLLEGIVNYGAVSQAKPNIATVDLWKGTSFGVGGIIVTGNLAETNYNGNANISYIPIAPWQNTLVISYLYNRDDIPDGKGVKTNKFQASGKTSWNFDKNNGVYAWINYLNDQLDTYTLSESVGYQRQLYSNGTVTLTGTVGPSLTQQKVKDIGEFSNGLGAQAGLDYVWNLTDTSNFKQSFLVNWTTDDATTYQTNSTLSTEIYKNFILQLDFQINGSSSATADKKRVNTVTSTTIAYSF